MKIQPLMAGLVSMSVLAAAAAAQQDSPKKEPAQPDQTDRAEKLGDQRATDKKQDDKPSEQNQRTALPECLTQLELTEQQTQDLLSIYRDSDMKSQQIWDRVQGLHRQAISMEAAAIAAARLEGHVHSAHQGQVGQPTDTDTAEVVDSEATKDPTTKAVGDKPAANAARKENAEKRTAGRNRDAKHANAAKNHQRDRKPADERNHSDVEDSVGWQGKDGELNIVAIRVGIAQPDGRVREYLLTQPGENTPSGPNKAFHSHQAQLTQIWKDIHDGHEQLVELEASTIVNVEAQLTELQLEKLDTIQSKVSNTSTDDVSR